MKHTKALSLTLAGGLAATIAVAGVALAGPPEWAGTGRQPSPSATATQAVASPELAAKLTWLRDEERLARDVYTALAARYDVAPFEMIATSEQRHFDAIGNLLTRYGVTDPAAGKAAGVFANAEIQAMYDRLIAQGATSVEQAYEAGIWIEQHDIADLKETLATFAETDVTRVATNQLRASEQHLAAFEAAKAGTPLGAHDRSAMGQGSGMGMGRGMGAGTRAGMGDGPGPQDGTGRPGRGSSTPGVCPRS